MRNKSGYYINEHNIIYVQGTVDGKFVRKSTRKQATKDNLNWIKKHHMDVLLKLTDKKQSKKTDFQSYGLQVLQNTSFKRSANQQRDVTGKFNNHLVPHFKNFNLQDIKTDDIENWRTSIKKQKNLSNSTINKTQEILNLIMKKALANDLVQKNYVELVDKLPTQHEKKVPYTEHELRLILEHSSGWFHTYLMLVASSGLRVGEAIGLKWEDIDLNNSFIDLKRSISKGKIVDNTSLTNKTKNHNRIIPLDQTTVKELVGYFQNKPNDTWVFVNQYDKPFYDGRNINKYYWKPLLAKLNIADRDMYTLRHTWLSIMKNNGADDNWLKAVGGWKQSSKVMDDHYYTFDQSKLTISNANNFFSHIEVNKKKVG
jgi:integrase